MKRWSGCIYFRRMADYESETLPVFGVSCTRTEAVLPERTGFAADGQMCLRIPIDKWPNLQLGDQVRESDSNVWYTVSVIRKNYIFGSPLSHYKVIGRR